ncbi:Lysozyme-like domain [Cordyceps militaris]|uniref:Lysozyme-like domain n=1 Tax=Cordyceps militaris TaxID=73501 RepID=A0A2H4SHZ1_CORMI|nr:Lysozyme-like domain [Cordyceps militaris]
MCLAQLLVKMKTFTSVALFSLVSIVAAYPAVQSIYARDCQPGHVVCQGEAMFGLCDLDGKATFMSVAAGTKCVCSGSDCTIVGLDGPPQPSQGAPAPAPAPTSQAPAPPSQAPAPPPPSQPAPAPTQSAAPAPPAASSTPGGVFQEHPTVTLPSAAGPTASAAPSGGSGGSGGGVDIGAGKPYFKTFVGKGDASAGWPEQSAWASFESMWKADLENVIGKSCAGFQQVNNSPAESADIKSAIESVAQSSGVDARFILAILMQESNGCVRAPTTNYGVTNPGLMQSHNGANSCFNVNPCPKDKIRGMIEDGVLGTSSGDGLKQLLAKAGGNDATAFYKAARMYNSGSVDPSGDLGAGIATHCYCSDIANRLIGWSSGVGGCHM